MKITEITENKTVSEDASGGGSSAGSVATVTGTGNGSKVGTLFGGTYQQPKIKKSKKRK